MFDTGSILVGDIAFCLFYGHFLFFLTRSEAERTSDMAHTMLEAARSILGRSPDSLATWLSLLGRPFRRALRVVAVAMLLIPHAVLQWCSWFGGWSSVTLVAGSILVWFASYASCQRLAQLVRMSALCPRGPRFDSSSRLFWANGAVGRDNDFLTEGTQPCWRHLLTEEMPASVTGTFAVLDEQHSQCCSRLPIVEHLSFMS